MELKIRNAYNYVKSRPSVCMTLIALASMMIVLLVPMNPANQMFTVVFDKELSSQSVGAAEADELDYVSDINVQDMTINGQYVSYRPDPLTYNTDKLTLKVTDVGNAHVVRVDAEVNTGGAHWWTAHRIKAENLAIDQSNGTVTITLDSNQVDAMIGGLKFFNPGRLLLFILVCAIWIAIILKRYAFASTPLPWFMCGVVIVALTVMGGWRVWANGMSLLRRVAIIGILFGFLILTGLNTIKASSKYVRYVIVLDYAVMLAVTIGQGLLYILKWSFSPDENAHLSYVAWEKAYRQLVPDFANIHTYYSTSSGIVDLSQAGPFNQLGHPPLYYLIMSFVPGIHVSGSVVTFHLAWLRAASLGILLCGLLLCAYLLHTRLPKIPLLHLVAALALIASPNMIQVSSGVNNDSLCLLTVTLAIWGLLRFRERKYTFTTYLLIMAGISATLLTKLTAGMIVAFMALFVAIAALLDKQSRKVFSSRKFWISTPVLLLPIAYYVTLLVRYRSIQPGYQKLDPAGYLSSGFYKSMSDRADWDVFQYLNYYISQFLRTWWSMPWQQDVPRTGITSFDPEAIAVTLVWLIPFGILFVGRKYRDRVGNTIAMGIVGMGITLLYQFHVSWNAFYVNGYTGGLQSRYYLCAIVIIVYSLCWLLQRWFVSSSGDAGLAMSRIGTVICAGFSMMLVWDGLLQPFLLQPVGISILG